MLWIFSFLCLFAYGSEFELFCDWAHEAKGQELFPLMEKKPLKDLPLMSLLRRKLIQEENDIRSWEIEKYRPYLLSWKGIHSFQDFKHFLGIGLTKKELINPNAKWIFWNLGPKLLECDFSKLPKEKLILVMWEPPTTQPGLYDSKLHQHFGKIFTWDDDLVDNQKYFKFMYPTIIPKAKNIPSFDAKKFCVMICRRLTSHHPNELYSKRKQMIQFFESKPDEEFDLFGHYWKVGKYTHYRGVVSDKIEKLKEYKFCICYENMGNVKGYITEKIFDCFAAGVVPVYWGASNVTDYIPEKCFIDRRKFASDEEVYEYLKAMKSEEYQTYLDATEKFLQSDQAKLFSTETFVETFLSQVLF